MWAVRWSAYSLLQQKDRFPIRELRCQNTTRWDHLLQISSWAVGRLKLRTNPSLSMPFLICHVLVECLRLLAPCVGWVRRQDQCGQGSRLPGSVGLLPRPRPPHPRLWLRPHWLCWLCSRPLGGGAADSRKTGAQVRIPGRYVRWGGDPIRWHLRGSWDHRQGAVQCGEAMCPPSHKPGVRCQDRRCGQVHLQPRPQPRRPQAGGHNMSHVKGHLIWKRCR